MTAPPAAITRHLPIGAEIVDQGVHFRLWAPRRSRITLIIESPQRMEQPLEPAGDGYFAGPVDGIGVGARYRFRLDDDPTLYPDPVSRYQPEGVHGPSQVIDPHAFRWSDAAWTGISAQGQVLYEMHIGTFTREGTWRAAMVHLQSLKD